MDIIVAFTDEVFSTSTGYTKQIMEPKKQTQPFFAIRRGNRAENSRGLLAL